MIARAFLCLATLLAWGCSPEPQPASPAFWQIETADGAKGWLLGTIHSLERPADWRSPAIGAALAEADMVVVEVAGLKNEAAMQATFNKLATGADLPALSSRVSPPMQGKLRTVLEETGLEDDGFETTETWAAALIIAQTQAQSRNLDSAYGIDRAVIAAAGDKPVIELEGPGVQLALFDRLPEAEQRDLLDAIISDAAGLSGESPALAEAWRNGNIALIERETGRGLLADPELRAALLTGRNTKWVERISGYLTNGRKPFVAVGAAHMAGPDGLPAMLEARGFSISRVQ